MKRSHVFLARSSSSGGLLRSTVATSCSRLRSRSHAAVVGGVEGAHRWSSDRGGPGPLEAREGARPVFPAHSTLSQTKYMALLRWPMVRHSRGTLSARWMALLAACSASTELPSRSTSLGAAPWWPLNQHPGKMAAGYDATSHRLFYTHRPTDPPTHLV
ncbi:hypothetical protein EYF80_053001 [Liparis tanakae]|uniref:Uncharacterized protein n=1 Tax=Liparis tanakae TaxID=230148 RepID=A0A4Z2F6Z8_9TELE|nr:hypothetical protein EYF80_053001 [Liparis tanakae]